MRTKALVGYTGFVGSNLYASTRFDAVYNSKNITDAYGTKPDLLIYAGLRAEKFLANSDSEKDMKNILEAEKNIINIAPKKMVLISTIDVFHDPVNVDEHSKIITDDLQPYGYNRYKFEQWVRENYEDALIIRLPALFGMNLKKNFIYDMMNIVPSMLKKEKLFELVAIDPIIENYYEPFLNDFYKLRNSTSIDSDLKNRFIDLNFTALNFTDSRSVFQFYPLDRLWNDIQVALDNNLDLWHPATEPIEAGELYKKLTGLEFKNHCSVQPLYYNYKTKFSELYKSSDGYIEFKENIIEKIRDFIKKNEYRKRIKR